MQVVLRKHVWPFNDVLIKFMKSENIQSLDSKIKYRDDE